MHSRSPLAVLISMLCLAAASPSLYADDCSILAIYEFTNPPEGEGYLINSNIYVTGNVTIGVPPAVQANKTFWIKIRNVASGDLMAEKQVTSDASGNFEHDFDFPAPAGWAAGAAEIQIVCNNQVCNDRGIMINEPP